MHLPFAGWRGVSVGEGFLDAPVRDQPDDRDHLDLNEIYGKLLAAGAPHFDQPIAREHEVVINPAVPEGHVKMGTPEVVLDAKAKEDFGARALDATEIFRCGPAMKPTRQSNPGAGPGSPERAAEFARLALQGIDREYPNQPGAVLRGPRDLLSPAVMHPAFHGCYDWHSAVHGHWLLVRLMRICPDLPATAEVRARLSAHLTAASLATEAAYFEPEEHRGFERMYGWAWALRLAAELKAWDDPDARQWAKNLAPLERRLVALTQEYLPRLTYPVRTGVHANTAFALAQMLDYARVAGDTGLEQTLAARARHYYLADRHYPADYEPSGEDFFSPGLNEADLMRRVLPPGEFSPWLDDFIPGLRAGNLGRWAQPAQVSDPTDGRIIHLAGLNLSRAWTLRGVESALAPAEPRRAVLAAAARAHEAEGLKQVFSGHYGGEHWLATFAVYHLTNTGI